MALSSTQQRRFEVLRAIVSDYIEMKEPVGSKALVDRHKLGVSSATVRNDMAVLEAEGYISQQHSSSGRIPTEKGYRRFVDSLQEVKPLSQAEHRAILKFLEQGVDMEDVLRRSVQLLAQLTQQVAVVQLPVLNTSRVRHCEVVQLTPVRLLLVLITDTGRVEQRNVDLTVPMSEDATPQLRALLNRVTEGKTMTDAAAGLADLAANGPSELRDTITRCATVLIGELLEQPPDRLILAGTSNLARQAPNFSVGLSTVLDALEEQVVLLKLLSAASDLHRVRVSIGEENLDEDLRNTAVVAASYGSGAVSMGGLGVVGPTFMDYAGTIAAVAAVAQYMGRVLGNE